MSDHGYVFDDPNRNLSFFRPEARVASEQRYIGWNVPPEDLQYIPEHWFKYDEPAKSMHYLLALVYTLFTIASLTGNGLVIWVFMSAKSLRSPSNIFVVNLAVLDFIMMLKSPVFIYNSINFGFALGNIGCQVFGLFGAYAGIGASLTNAFIAYDRFNVITRPMDGRLTFTKALCLIAFIWTYSTPWALMPLFRVWGRFVPASDVRYLGWDVPPEQLQYIPEHWLTQPEPEYSMHYLLAMLYSFLFVASLLGNGCVIFIFSSAKSLRTPSNLFVLNLAVFDLIMMLKAPIFIYNSIHHGFALGNTFCQLFASIGSYSGIGAGMTNAFIGYDRFNAITRPMDRSMTFTKALIINVLIWCYCTPWVVFPVTRAWGRFVPASDVRYLGWDVPPEQLQYIPEHWLTQPEPEYSMHYLLAMLYSFLFVASLLGNGCVIFIFSSAKSLRTPSNLFVLNLAVFDLIMMLKAPIFIYNSIHHGFALGNTFCQLFASIGSYSGIGAGMTNAFIGYDRFNAITRPMDRSMTFTKALIINVLIWCYCTPWVVFPVTRAWGRFVPASDVRYLGWDVPPEQLQYIPEHWLTQPEPEYSMHYLLAMLYSFLFVASLLGNGCVIFIFSSAKSLRTPSNLFVLNLAVFDLIMMLKAPIFIYNSIHHGFALGNTFCQLFASIGSYSGIGAGMTNAFIGYDRFNAITRPMDRSMTFTKALIINVLIWCYCTPWVVFPVTRAWGRFVPEGYLTSCSFDYLTDDFDTRLFVGTIFFCSFCMPTAMILYYYSQIVGHVFSHEKALREQAKKMNVESLRSNVDKNKDTAEIRIAKAAITICFLFFVSWTPYGVMSLIGAFGDKNLLTPGVTMIPACTCKMVACIDPYVYAISHPKYRLELQKRLPWLAINEKAPEAASAASTGTTQENQTTAA